MPIQFEARDVDQVYDFNGSCVVSDADCPPAGNYPDKILMRNLKMSLIRQINRKGLERGLLPRLSDLFCRHAQLSQSDFPMSSASRVWTGGSGISATLHVAQRLATRLAAVG